MNLQRVIPELIRKTITMTPTEKAAELIGKFYDPILYEVNKNTIKNNAVICANNIIQTITMKKGYDEKELQYWVEVKNVINETIV